MGNEQGKLQGVPTPAGIQSMDETLQKKFAKGIQYNSKLSDVYSEPSVVSDNKIDWIFSTK